MMSVPGKSGSVGAPLFLAIRGQIYLYRLYHFTVPTSELACETSGQSGCLELDGYVLLPMSLVDTGAGWCCHDLTRDVTQNTVPACSAALRVSSSVPRWGSHHEPIILCQRAHVDVGDVFRISSAHLLQRSIAQVISAASPSVCMEKVLEAL